MKHLGDLNRHGGLILAVAFVVLQLLDVMTYPLFVYDEALLNDAGWQLATTGRFRADILSINPGFEHHYLWQPPGLPLAAALSYKLFGLGIWQTRLPDILFSGGGVWAVYALTRSLTAGTSAPWIAALSLFFWPEWVLTAKESRMDTAAILGMVLSTHLVIRALCSTGPHVLRTLFLAGLCASAATIFHSTALLWTFSLAVIVFLFARDRLTSSLVYGIGAAVFGLAWIAYALQYPAEFQAQYLALLINRTGGGGVLLRLVSEGERYVREFARLPTIYLVVLVAAGGLIVERCWSDRRIRILLVLTVLVFLTHGVLAGKVSGFYTLYPMTLAFCVVGIGIDAALTEDRPAPGRRWFAAGAMVVVAAFLLNLSAFSVGPRILAFLYQGPERDYARQLEGLTRHLAPGDQVWGSAVTWLAVTKAGARLDALDWVPREKEPEPDPLKHKFVVVFRGDDFAGMEAYRKIDEVGTETPRIFGATLTNRPYTFDLWRSRSLP